MKDGTAPPACISMVTERGSPGERSGEVGEQRSFIPFPFSLGLNSLRFIQRDYLGWGHAHQKKKKKNETQKRNNVGSSAPSLPRGLGRTALWSTSLPVLSCPTSAEHPPSGCRRPTATCTLQRSTQARHLLLEACKLKKKKQPRNKGLLAASQHSGTKSQRGSFLFGEINMFWACL